jgi:phosphatidylserine/phosphatidylglycerophosphate/cardiolipin synthase-like enzyme
MSEVATTTGAATAAETPATAAAEAQEDKPAIARTVTAAPTDGRPLLKVLYRWSIRFLWVIGGVSLGLVIIKLNPSRVARLGFSGGNYHVLTHPSNAATDISIGVIADQISKAEKEVLVVGGRLTSRKILDALIERNKSGVQVTLLLPNNPGQSEMVKAYLTNNGLAQCLVSPSDFDEQFVLIDGTRLLIGTVPWSAKASKSMRGSIIATSDRAAIQQMRSYFKERVLESSQPK